LPEGEWTHLLTGEVREGRRWCAEALDFFGLPLWIRPNAVIALGPELGQVEYYFAAGLRLLCGKLDGSTPCSVEIVDGRGRPATHFTLEQDGRRVTVTNQEGRTDFRVQLPWASQVDELGGGALVGPPPARGRVAGDPGGIVIQASASRVSFVWR
jgi:alpha-D-xyloside xylohydrolase